jgi:LPXTG-motif cell wall-anchored protein
MKRNDATAPAGSWAVNALLALGGWLVVSPLALSTTQVTACLVSAVTGGLALLVLAGWARVARNRVPPLAIACSLGLWLLLAPSMWEFGDGVDSDPGLVPINPSEVTEPTRAILARAEWNSILAGLLILLLAGSVLLARRRRQDRSAPTTGGEPR